MAMARVKLIGQNNTGCMITKLLTMLTRALFKSLFSCSSPLQRYRTVSSSMRRTRFSCWSDSQRIVSCSPSSPSALDDPDAPPSDVPHGTSTDERPESLSMSLPNATSDIFLMTRLWHITGVKSLQLHLSAVYLANTYWRKYPYYPRSVNINRKRNLFDYVTSRDLYSASLGLLTLRRIKFNTALCNTSVFLSARWCYKVVKLSPMQTRSSFGSYWKGSEWRPKRKLQINRRDSDKESRQEIKSRISEYWCTRHASTNNHSTCALWTSRRRSTLSPMISSWWLWWTWDILYTWLTCWPNYIGNSMNYKQ